MKYGRLLRTLRTTKNLTQAEVAERAAVGLSQPQISQIEYGTKTPTHVERLELERVLALGQSRRCERLPHYCLATAENAEGGMVTPLFGGDGEFGIYRKRASAELATKILRYMGISAEVVPLWAEHAARQALDVSGPGGGRLALVDRDDADTTVINAICAHCGALTQKIRADERALSEAQDDANKDEVDQLVRTLLSSR